MSDHQAKIQATHLRRNAYLYVRQSTPRQVIEHRESTERQYGLRQRAIALGWPEDQIVVIDSDLGQSGASSTERAGFQRLVSEVGLGHAGLVLGLEVSRLARNSSDWYRLLEICALTDTLLLDEDGLYHPGDFNDRLLLGLKGTMSEAELHLLRARMRGGLLNKAKRAELQMYLPIGFTYDAIGRVVLDPDQQVQQSVRLVFDTFQRLGSALAVVREFQRQGLLFPRHRRAGPDHADVVWKPLTYALLSRLLHNPRYAGAFVYGRTRKRPSADGSGSSVQRLPLAQWQVLVKEAHPSYVSWEQYEANQARLQENTTNDSHPHSPPREGPALLQGLVLCGLCGQRMHPRYTVRQQHLWPYYVCPRQDLAGGPLTCQHIPGHVIDQAVSELLVATVTPVALELALAVQQQIQEQLEQADRLRRTQVERARYEAQLARRRYLQVDPDHRLVADTLEADWNQKLRALAAAEQDYERQRQADRLRLDESQRQRVQALAQDFRQLWQDPGLPQRERKRMARLLLEDVTLVKQDQITIQVRFRGGMTEILRVPLPLNAHQKRKTAAGIVGEIDGLLEEHTSAEVAQLLNERQFRTTEGQPFTTAAVDRVVHNHHLRSRYVRLREQGYLTIAEVASREGMSCSEVWRQRKQGRCAGLPYGTNKYLYQPLPTVSGNQLTPEVAI
jgi:DNA invertase Pin-like site-specific DNA recombinase